MVFAFAGILLAPAFPLRAEESLLQTVSEKSKAVVTLQSVNATVLAGKPQGIFDKATGRILIIKKVRPVGYARNGSGVIIDPKGIILANAHTVRGAGAISVTFFDGSKAPVKEIHIVPNSDLAFLLIQPPFALNFISPADSDAVSPGTEIFLLGHSQHLQETLIGGKIIGFVLEPGPRRHATHLQISPGVYTGDSGSPVLDRNGNLLGIISAGLPGRTNGTFAIASNEIAAAYQNYLKKFKKN